MELQKLNKIAGILAIVGAVVFPISFWFIAAAVVGDVMNILEGGSGAVQTPAIAWVFNIFALILVGLFIYALIQSKKENLKTTGHVLGIIGSAYYFISPIFPGIVAMILLIIAAVQLLRLAKTPSLAEAE